MKNNESFQNDSVDNGWDLNKEGVFWPDELHYQIENRKEVIDNYRAASEAFRLDFNERATGTSKFSEWVNSGEDGIFEEDIKFNDNCIKVFHLTGHKFLALVHCIDYHGSNADKYFFPESHKKSKEIREDPNNWATTPIENNPKNVDNGIARNSFSNNISGSLVSDKVPDGYWGDDKNAIYYGFSNLGLRRVVKAGRGDMRVNQGWTSNISNEEDARAIQSIDEIESLDRPNEVAFDRYEEDSGRPILPDFIFCPNFIKESKDLTDAQKQHASFFNIPIVILHKDKYEY